MAASGRSEAHTQENLNSSNRDPESQQDNDGGGIVASAGLSTCSRENPSMIDGDYGGQLEANEPQTAPRSSNDTHSRRSPISENENMEGQPGNDRPGMAANGREDARTQDNSNSVTGDAGSQSGDDRRGVEVGADSSACPQNISSPANKIARGQSEDELRIGVCDSDNASTRKNFDLASRNVESQPQGDGPGVADGGIGAAPTRENPDSTHRSTGGGHRRSGSKRGNRSNSGPQSQLKSPGNTGSNLDDRPRPPNIEATGGVARDHRGPAGMHAPNNGRGGTLDEPGNTRALDGGAPDYGGRRSRSVRRSHSHRTQPRDRNLVGDGNTSTDHSQSWLDAPATGYSDQKRSPDDRRRPTSAGESSSGNPWEGMGTFGHKELYRVGEGSQSTRDTSTIDTSIEYRNTQGKFDSNSGSYNNYGDENSKFVNDGTLVNHGNMSVNITRADGGEGLKISGRYSISHPTYMSRNPTNIKKYSATAPRGEELHVPWMVPYCQNREFKGRRDILSKVESKTEKRGHNRVALWGLGGTGYGYTHRHS